MFQDDNHRSFSEFQLKATHGVLGSTKNFGEQPMHFLDFCSVAIDGTTANQGLNSLMRTKSEGSLKEMSASSDNSTQNLGKVQLPTGDKIFSSRSRRHHDLFSSKGSYASGAHTILSSTSKGRRLFYGAIQIESGQPILLVLRLPDDYAVWMGEVKPLSYFGVRYQVDIVFYVDEIAQVLQDRFSVHGSPLLFILYGSNIDNGDYSKPANFEGIEQFDPDSSQIEVKSQTRPGMKEYQLEGIFLYHVYVNGGCRYFPYTCLCAIWKNSTTQWVEVALAIQYYRDGSDEVYFLDITGFIDFPLENWPRLEILSCASKKVVVSLTVDRSTRDFTDAIGIYYSSWAVVSEYFRTAVDQISIGSAAVLAAEVHLPTGVKTGRGNLEQFSRVYDKNPEKVQFKTVKVSGKEPIGEEYAWYHCTMNGGRDSRLIGAYE